jgi:tRNA threonylcarbamoyladenosine biosynthesis protein TsaB
VDATTKVLVIDTCGETAGVALCAGAKAVARQDLAPGRASAEIVDAVRRLLAGADWRLTELDAVGVVSGPGSFTGMRTGLSAAKGLCEGAGLRLVAVSRLEVLAEASGVSGGYVALDAGRGEVYAREVGSGREWLSKDDELMALVRERSGLVVAEGRVAMRLAACAPALRPLDVSDALGVVLRGESVDAAGVDANYVRGEREIYGAGAAKRAL